MPTLAVRGAQIYYEILGEDRSGQLPILLIHGSTITGQEDWATVAPILACRRRVIVPDCRGHGRSDNPNHSYSFSEMAADLAVLLQALGYPRAHVVGHSNGGNVALVMLVEHPEVVQTAVCQAANAYVDQYLLDREPDVFDPQRVERDSPQWKEQMVRLHGPYHGPDYWRELLALTLKETLSAPSYTPQDLAGVQRPALIVQGALDPVNAPSGHAEYIARHIPGAELWTPAGVKHNVHLEATAEWIARIESFFEQRGDPLNDSLYRLGCERYLDRREWVYELRADQASADGVRLSGEVLRPEQLEPALRRATACLPEPANVDVTGVRILLTEAAPWALANRNVSDLRAGPSYLKERLSQALLGEAVRVLEDRGEWSRVRMERDGYLGWMKSAALHRCTEAEVHAYTQSCRHWVQAELLPAWQNPETAGAPAQTCGKLPFGIRVAVGGESEGWARICLPDGRSWWAAADGLLPVERLPNPDADGVQTMLQWVQRFSGVPYLWGGRTPFGYDCSGLSGAFWEPLGVTLMRDADQQFRQGVPVEGDPRPGDLLFFGEPKPEDHGERFAGEHLVPVTHVAISLGGDRVLNATGSRGAVVVESLDPDSPIYRAWLRDNLVGIRRYI